MLAAPSRWSAVRLTLLNMSCAAGLMGVIGCGGNGNLPPSGSSINVTAPPQQTQQLNQGYKDFAKENKVAGSGNSSLSAAARDRMKGAGKR